jgi:hypothetical protein
MADAEPLTPSAASTCSPSVSNAWRRDGSLLDELGYLPFAQAGGQLFAIGLEHMATQWLTPPDQPSLRAHLDHRDDEPGLRGMALRVRRCEDDDGAARSHHPPLRSPLSLGVANGAVVHLGAIGSSPMDDGSSPIGDGATRLSIETGNESWRFKTRA